MNIQMNIKMTILINIQRSEYDSRLKVGIVKFIHKVAKLPLFFTELPTSQNIVKNLNYLKQKFVDLLRNQALYIRLKVKVRTENSLCVTESGSGSRKVTLAKKSIIFTASEKLGIAGWRFLLHVKLESLLVAGCQLPILQLFGQF